MLEGHSKPMVVDPDFSIFQRNEWQLNHSLLLFLPDKINLIKNKKYQKKHEIYKLIKIKNLN